MSADRQWSTEEQRWIYPDEPGITWERLAAMPAEQFHLLYVVRKQAEDDGDDSTALIERLQWAANQWTPRGLPSGLGSGEERG